MAISGIALGLMPLAMTNKHSLGYNLIGVREYAIVFLLVACRGLEGGKKGHN